jgi:riboflavin kinase/FMN adenylyltransferase
MHVLRTLDQLASIRHPVVAAAGVFDGVHLGHQQVIRLCHERASALGAEPWLMTFDPHPLRIVQPAAAPALLTSLPLKLDLVAGLGLAGTMVIPFTPDFAALEPDTFLDHLLGRLPLLRGLVIGENWRFGRQAKGNVTLLRTLAAQRNLDVAAATPVLSGASPVSSTRIREAIARGDLDQAATLLGRPHAVRGPVIHGQKRGRRLGFPTANLDVRGCAIPPSGIYAARVTLDGHTHAGALYLPASPEPQHGALEVHLIDYTGDLYGRELDVAFIGKIREDDRRFSDEADLIRQIRDDVTAIRNRLA